MALSSRAVVDERLDAELGVRLQRDERIVGEAQLRVALRAGDDGVAGVDRGAGDEADPVGAAHRDDVADREHDLAGGLREGRAPRAP